MSSEIRRSHELPCGDCPDYGYPRFLPYDPGIAGCPVEPDCMALDCPVDVDCLRALEAAIAARADLISGQMRIVFVADYEQILGALAEKLAEVYEDARVDERTIRRELARQLSHAKAVA